MAFLNAQDFSDAVLGILAELGPKNYQQIAQSRPEYELFSRWFKKGNIKLHSGLATRRQLLNRIPDAAAHNGWLDPDTATIYDVMDTVQVEWVHAVKGWAMFYQEALMGAGPEEIFDHVKAREDATDIALIEEIDSKGWTAPASSSDKKNPWGIAYWIVKNASTGFNGGAASGHTTVGTVSLTNSPTFKNYTFQYAGVDKVDLLPKMRTAMMKCKFVSPIPGNDYAKQTGRFCMYVNTDTMVAMETVGESQNENLGRDLAPPQYGVGMLQFRGFEIRKASALDSDATNPIYGIDHSTFEVHGLKGDWFRETKKPAATQHNCVEHYTDVTYNYLCIDRRRNFVGATA